MYGYSLSTARKAETLMYGYSPETLMYCPIKRCPILAACCQGVSGWLNEMVNNNNQLIIIIIIIIIIINRRSGITSHTSYGHKTGTRSMQMVRSGPRK